MVTESQSCLETSAWDKVFHRWFEDEIASISPKLTTADGIRSCVILGSEIYKSTPWLMNKLWADWTEDKKHRLSGQIIRVPWRCGESIKDFLLDSANFLGVNRNKLSILTPLCALPMFKAYPSLISNVYQRFLESQYASRMRPKQKTIRDT